MRHGNKAVGEEAQQQIAAFESTVYFTLGDAAQHTRAQAEKLRQAFEALPPVHTSAPHALERALISKLPEALEKQAKDLLFELAKSEQMDDPKPPWGPALAHHRRRTSAALSFKF